MDTSAANVSVKGFTDLNETSNSKEDELKYDQIYQNGKKRNESSSDEQTDERMSKPSNGSPRPLKVKPSAGERIASVTDNPFYKLGGGRPFKSSGSEIPAFLKRSRNCFDTDDLREYKPASGHVHKLSGKFASLESASFAKLKHASSADDILDERDDDDDKNQQGDGNRSWVNSLSHRAGSVESLNPRKVSPVFPVALRNVERKWAPVSGPQRSPRGAHTEAPDIKLARDDIILIEKPPEPSPPERNDEEEEKAVESEPPELKGEPGSAELPKLNTVSAFRGLFEVSRFEPAASQTFETNSNRESPKLGSSGSESSGLYSSAGVQDSSLYSGAGTDLSRAGFSRDVSATSSVDPDSGASIQSLPEIFQVQEESKSWKLDVKTDDDGSGSSRSSTPPPLPVSPPPLPLSPPPPLPSSPSPGFSTTNDDEVPDVRADVLDVQGDISDIQADISDDKSEVCVPSKSEKETSPSVPPLPPKPFIQAVPSEQTVLPPALKPVPASKPLPTPSLPRSIGTVKATPVYHPIPFRSSNNVFRPGSIAPMSFTPNVKKSSLVASVAPFQQQNRAENEGAENRFPFLSNFGRSSSPKRAKDYCDVVVERGVSTLQRETEEVKKPEESVEETEKEEMKEPDVTQPQQTDEKNEQRTETKQEKDDDEVNVPSSVITQEETTETSEADHSQKETPEAKEATAQVNEKTLDETKETGVLNNTDTVSLSQPSVDPSEADAEWIPSLHSAEPDATENLWKLALKPVARRAEDSQPKPVAVQPVPIAVASSVLMSGPQDTSQSELSVQPSEKAETEQPASSSSSSSSELSDLAKTDVKEEPVQVKSTESINLPEMRKEEVKTHVKSKEEVKPQSKSEDNDSLTLTTGAGKRVQRETKTDDSNSVSTHSNSQSTSSESAESAEPVRGIPTIIANRLKQSTHKQDSDTAPSRSPGELFGVRLSRVQQRRDTDAPENRETPQKHLARAGGDKSPPEPSSTPEIVNQFANVLKKKDPSSRNRTSGVSQIFDSSQLQKKWKEKRAAKAAAAAASLSEVDGRGGQGQVPPCNIEFIGGNVSTGRSLLGKNRRVKINVQFQEAPSKTFEYPSEEEMLQDYLKKHPGEVLVLDEVAWPVESSSDEVDIRRLLRRGGLDSPDASLLKSNTSLAHSGSLQSYRSKFQQDYQLGSILNFPEKPPEPQTSADPSKTDPDSMEILPTPEEDLQTYSLDTSSDLLF